MAKKIKVWDGTKWEDVTPSLPVALIDHSHNQYIDKNIIDAAGDLIYGAGDDTPARLAIGTAGQVLQVNSGATAPEWSTPTSAGNLIINGAFDFWQRGTSIVQTGGQYTADRWRIQASTAVPTRTITQESFTPNELNEIGFGDARFYFRSTLTTVGSSTGVFISQRVEDVRSLANQTATVSFYAKSDSTRTQTVDLRQNFGSGGSATVTFGSNTFSTTTSWQRFSFTISVPSISGKTLGANSFIELHFTQALADGSVLDVWGVQLEANPIATSFKPNANSLSEELAACQRYYYRIFPNDTNKMLAIATTASTTLGAFLGQFPTTMRVAPTALEQSGTASDYAVNFAGTATTCSVVPTFGAATTDTHFLVTFTVASGLTAGQGGRGITNGTNAFLGWSAEL
jgi:hypothetical protein